MATNSYMGYRVRTPNGKVEYFEEEKAALSFVQSDIKGSQRLLSEYVVEKCVLRAVAAKKHITTYWQRIPMSPTDIENDLRKALLVKGYVENKDFVFQYPFGWYTLDFAFVEEKIDVECDGEYWHPQENASDRNRDAIMKKNGWDTLRFTGKQIKTNLEDVITQIDTAVRRVRQRHPK